MGSRNYKTLYSYIVNNDPDWPKNNGWGLGGREGGEEGLGGREGGEGGEGGVFLK